MYWLVSERKSVGLEMETHWNKTKQNKIEIEEGQKGQGNWLKTLLSSIHMAEECSTEPPVSICLFHLNSNFLLFNTHNLGQKALFTLTPPFFFLSSSAQKISLIKLDTGDMQTVILGSRWKYKHTPTSILLINGDILKCTTITQLFWIRTCQSTDVLLH